MENAAPLLADEAPRPLVYNIVTVRNLLIKGLFDIWIVFAYFNWYVQITDNQLYHRSYGWLALAAFLVYTCGYVQQIRFLKRDDKPRICDSNMRLFATGVVIWIVNLLLPNPESEEYFWLSALKFKAIVDLLLFCVAEFYVIDECGCERCDLRRRNANRASVGVQEPEPEEPRDFWIWARILIFWEQVWIVSRNIWDWIRDEPQEPAREEPRFVQVPVWEEPPIHRDPVPQHQPNLVNRRANVHKPDQNLSVWKSQENEDFAKNENIIDNIENTSFKNQLIESLRCRICESGMILYCCKQCSNGFCRDCHTNMKNRVLDKRCPYCATIQDSYNVVILPRMP